MPPRALNLENFLPFPLDIVITPYRLGLSFPRTLSPFRLRQSQRKLGIVVPKLCVTTTIVRQDWAKLMKTHAGSTKKGWRKGWDLPRNRYSNRSGRGKVWLIVTNTDPGLPNYKLMSRGNFARNNFLLLYLITPLSTCSAFKQCVYPKRVSCSEFYSTSFVYIIYKIYRVYIFV